MSARDDHPLGSGRPRRRRLLAPGLASAVLAAVAVFFVVVYLRDRAALKMSRLQLGTVATFEGARSLQLPDGSHVELQSGSLQVQEVGPARVRMALRRGQAMFRIQKIPLRRRELIVEAGTYEVLVTGTVFGVSVQEGGRVSVDVVDGEVGIRRPGATTPFSHVHAREHWSSDTQ